jgi:hypothetical protein
MYDPEAVAERAEYWREQREDAEMLRQFNASADYAERAYFDGDHCQHCADRDEHLRLERIAATYRKAVDRARRDRRDRDQVLRHRIKTWTGEW